MSTVLLSILGIALTFAAYCWFFRPFECRHPRRIVCKQVRDGVPYVKMFCEDCDYQDEGHVHGPLEGWVEGVEHIRENNPKTV